MKKRVSSILLLLVFLAGLCILGYPWVSNWMYQRHSAAENQAYHTAIWGLSQEVCDDLWAQAEDYNRQVAQRENQLSLTEEQRAEAAHYLNPMGIGQMGYLSIPKIGVEIPIYQGTEETQLQAGAGWWIGTSLPTGGESTHCVLAAHNGLVKAKLFTDLDQLAAGDRFSLTILDRVLTYEVDQILVTQPEDLSPLTVVPGQDLVTLYTCTPYGVNTHRLLVRGHRVETPDQAAPAKDRSWVPVLLAPSALLLALAILDRHRGLPPKSRRKGGGTP